MGVDEPSNTIDSRADRLRHVAMSATDGAAKSGKEATTEAAA